MWINRDISDAITANRDFIQVVRGPRQCGKSSLILHLDPDFVEISLDDPGLRSMARTDPVALLSQFEDKKIFIDEAQYAPELFPVLKRQVDLRKRRGGGPQTLIRLTGSNQILMDRTIKESLAGRASFFDMNTLSVSEVCRARTASVQEILYMGGWPELHASSDKDPKKYLDDYINSYVERDIVLAAGVQKQSDFLRFARLLAGRVAQILDFSSLARDVGVDAKTIKGWVSILERMGIIALLPPYFTNLSKRLIKSPKVYFIDTGLACRLQGWSSPEPIFTSPQQGPLFENLVFAELHKLNLNFQLGWQLFHWRSREGEEVDFLIMKDPETFQFLEAKISFQRPKDLATYPEIRKVFRSPPPIAHCVMSGDRAHSGNVPIKMLAEFLMKTR